MQHVTTTKGFPITPGCTKLHDMWVKLSSTPVPRLMTGKLRLLPLETHVNTRKFTIESIKTIYLYHVAFWISVGATREGGDSAFRGRDVVRMLRT